MEIALKWAIAALKAKMEDKPNGGIKTKVDGMVTSVPYTEILATLERMKIASEEERLKIVTFCNDCKAFTGGAKAKSGCCFPKQYTSSRFGKDFCSLYEDEKGIVRRGLY